MPAGIHQGTLGSYALTGNDSFVQILLHGDGANAGTTFTDSSAAARTFTRTGSVVTSTAQVKFGTASLLFDGSSDYLSTPDAASLRPGTGDYTVDGWVYTTDAANNSFYSKGWTASGDFLIQVSSSKKAGVFHSGITLFTDTNDFPENQWVHFAVVRSSGTVTGYINGTSFGSASGTQNLNSTKVFYVGGNPVAAVTSVDGYIDELRFSPGIARWTANFTPPTRPYG